MRAVIHRRALFALGVGASLVAGTVSGAKVENPDALAAGVGSGLVASSAPPPPAGELPGSGLEIPVNLTTATRDPWRARETIDPWAPAARQRARVEPSAYPMRVVEIVDPWPERAVPRNSSWEIIDPWPATRTRGLKKNAP